jgi:hypothetical protein
MTRSTTFTVLAAVLIALLWADTASAVLHPKMGRYLQRDPNGTAIAPPNRVDSARPYQGGSFAQRDRGAHPYADGMNLYQYMGSNPVKYVDPSGLERMVAVIEGQDFLIGDIGKTNQMR